MKNPILQALNSQRNNTNPLQELMNFSRQIKGNPQAIVQNMLQSGQMSQQQYNELYKQATDIMKKWHL